MEKRLHRILFISVCLLTVLGVAAGSGDVKLRLQPEFAVLNPEFTNQASVLSINNSLIQYNDHDQMFMTLASNQGRQADFVEHTLWGMTLGQHWGEGDWYGNDGELSAKALVRSQPWTHIILQEYSTLPRLSPQLFKSTLKKWVDYIRQYCPNPAVQIIVPMNWPYRTDNENYNAYDQLLVDGYLEAAYECGVTLCPWGVAFKKAHDNMTTSVFNTWYVDERHPSVKSTYMMVCMEYALVFGVDPQLITWRPSNVSVADAQMMREYASTALSEFAGVVDPVRRQINYRTTLIDSLGQETLITEGLVFHVQDGETVSTTGLFTCDTVAGLHTVGVRYDTLASTAQVQMSRHQSMEQLGQSLVVNSTDTLISENFTTAQVNGLVTLPSGWRADCHESATAPQNYASASRLVTPEKALVIDPLIQLDPGLMITDTLTGRRSLRVLVIGNGYTLDALAYLPQVLMATNPDVDFRLGILHLGNGSLAVHKEWIDTNQKPNYLYWNGTSWGIPVQRPYESIVALGWDLVVFQQNEKFCADYRTVGQPLKELVDWLLTQGFEGKLGWITNHPYQDGNPNLSSVVDSNDNVMTTSDGMMAAINDVAQKVMAMAGADGQPLIDVMLPCGQALQRARDMLPGDLGSQLSFNDKEYLLQGLGPLVESCAAALALGGGYEFCPVGTPGWPYQPWAHGEMIGMDDESQQLAWQCAADLFADPREEAEYLGVMAYGRQGRVERLGGRVLADSLGSVNVYARVLNNGFYGLDVTVTSCFDVEPSSTDTCQVKLYYSFDGHSWLPAGDNFCVSFAPGDAACQYVMSGVLPVELPHSLSLYLAWNITARGDSTSGTSARVAMSDVEISCRLPQRFFSCYSVFVKDYTGWDDLYLHISGDGELLGPWPGSHSTTEIVMENAAYKVFPLDSDGGEFILTFNDGDGGHRYYEFVVEALHDYYLKLEEGKIENLFQLTAVSDVNEDARLRLEQGMLLSEGLIVVCDLQGRVVTTARRAFDVRTLPEGFYIAHDGCGHALKIRR